MIELLIDYGDDILAGLLGTLLIVGIGFLLGTLGGALLVVPLVSTSRFLRWPARSYVELVRNTPFLIQAMLLFALFGVLR